MKSARVSFGWRLLSWLAAGAIACLGAPTASALTVRPMDLDEVIKSSDTIFTATCEGKETVFRAKNIVTIYTLKPNEIWKGDIATDAKGTFQMEEVGGTFGEKGEGGIRITQYVGGGASMIPGEEVLLFTHKRRPAPSLAAGEPQVFSPGNPEIVGRFYGRFTILTDPGSGEKYLIRPGLEARGVVPGDAAIREFLNAQQKALAGNQGVPATQGVSAKQAMEAAQRSQQVRQKIDAAEKVGRAQSKTSNGKAREILEYEKLGMARQRIKARIEEIAGQTRP